VANGGASAAQRCDGKATGGDFQRLIAVAARQSGEIVAGINEL
jgi:hypothetical protein